MTPWLRDLLPKKEQMEELETQIVVKRNNLMSLFREDDRADAESRGVSWGLRDTLLKREDSSEIKASKSVLDSENKLGVLAQLVHLWACGNHNPSSLSISKEAENLSQDCYQDVEFSTLVVRHGDCLSEISRLVGIPMEVLQRVNSIANIEYLKVAALVLFRCMALL